MSSHAMRHAHRHVGGKAAGVQGTTLGPGLRLGPRLRRAIVDDQVALCTKVLVMSAAYGTLHPRTHLEKVADSIIRCRGESTVDVCVLRGQSSPLLSSSY